jgi:DnaJ-class molecular chaperone
MAVDNRMRDPYAVLGVSRSADQTEIKAAWRSMAKKLHPDQNRSDPNAQSRFTEVGRAYDLLKDPDKRRRYDEMLNRASFNGGYGASPSGQSSGTAARAGKEPTFMEKRAEKARQEAEARARAEAEARMREEAEAKARIKAAADAARARAEASEAEPVEEAPEADVTPEQHEQFFEKLFGSRRSSDRSRTGEAPQAERRGAAKGEKPKAEAPGPEASRTETPKAEAPEYEAPKSEAQKSEAPRSEASHADERSHAEEQARSAYAQEPEEAHGEASASPARNLFSYLVQRLTRQASAPEKAPDHNVDAHVTIEDLLTRVNPTITLPDGKLLSVPLPDDAMDGTTVRMDGYGHKLPGMKRGDVLVTLRIKPHKWYRVDHYDLVTFHEIDIENAVLGCDATVETPDGPVRIRVPEWSGSNRTVKIEGKGLPRGNGRRGNLIVEIRVMLWDRPDQKVVDLMRSMREGLFL